MIPDYLDEARRFKPLAVFSRNNHADAEAFETWARVTHTWFKRVEGTYKGEADFASYVVELPHETLADMTRGDLPRFWQDQESVLVLAPEQTALGARVAFLFDVVRGTSTALGVWRQIDKAARLRYDGWTRDGTRYYAVTPFLHNEGRLAI